MSKLDELREKYTDEEIITMVESEYLCVLETDNLMDKLRKHQSGGFVMIPRFVMYNLRNQFIKLEKEKDIKPLFSQEIIEFVDEQEGESSKNRGTYIASESDIKAWIEYFRVYDKH